MTTFQTLTGQTRYASIKGAFMGYQKDGTGGGPIALITAIIAQAAIDLEEGDAGAARTAARYFLSDDYQHHLSWLDIPAGTLPAGVTLDVLNAVTGSAGLMRGLT